MKNIYLSLLLMTAANMFASGGGADKYGNVDTGAHAGCDDGQVSLSESLGSADGGGGSKDVSASATATTDLVTAHSAAPRANRFSSRNAVFNIRDLTDNITSFLTAGEASERLGCADRACNQIGERRLRFIYAARAAQPITLDAQAGAVTALLVLSDGRIAVGYQNGIIRLWNPGVSANNPDHVVVLTGHRTGYINCLVELSNGRMFSTAYSENDSALVWNLVDLTHQPAWILLSNTKLIQSATVLLDGRLVFESGCTSASKIKLWDPSLVFSNVAECTRLSGTFEKAVGSLAALSEGGYFVAGYQNGLIEIFNPAVSREPVLLGCCAKGVMSLVVLDNGHIVSGSSDGLIQMWNPATPGADPVELGRCKGKIWQLTALSKGHVVSGSDDGKVQIWNSKAPGSAPVLLRNHKEGAICLRVLRDGRIVSGSEDGTVQLQQPERYFMDKVERTQDPKDYLVDGAGVYDILFPGAVKVNKPVAAEVQSFSEVETGVGGGGSKDDIDVGAL